MKQNDRWCYPRHKWTTEVLRATVGIYARMKYHIRVEPFREEGKRPYLILLNHQTGFDQFFVGMTFRQPIYYLASEDIFSMGFVSDIIRYLVAPIPIRKQTTDLQAVKTCIRVAREGSSICIAPEGNRTFHGRTVYIKPAIASLAKKLGMPIAILRLEGGYGVQPRWSDVVRKGSMRCYVKRVIEPEEYAHMDKAALDALLIRELTADEGHLTGVYRHKKNAEYLERVVYTCPECGLAPFESRADRIRCTKCGLTVRHLPTKELEGVDTPFPHKFVADWYDRQCEYIRSVKLPEGVLFEDAASLYRVNLFQNKRRLKKNVPVALFRDKLTVDGQVYTFDALTAVTVLGKNKLNLYTEDGVFQLKGSKRFNALKYVNLYNKFKSEKAGEYNEQFLGL